MNNKSNKGIYVFLGILIFIACVGGLLGLFSNMKSDNEDLKPENIEYKISYKYYLDGEETKDLPKNQISAVSDVSDSAEEKYTFQKYSCTNKVTGNWNNEEWIFTPNKTSDSTCHLYFISNYFEVSTTAVNGKVNVLDSLAIRTIKRGESIVFSITPNAGYKYDKVTCTNDATAVWNEENSNLTVSNVTKKTNCEITFSKDEYVVEAKANNGLVTEEKVTTEYGKEVTFTVTPSEGYVFNKVTCTNSQTATWKDNKLTITNITKATTCTVDFKINKFKVTLVIVNGEIPSTTTNPQDISLGRNATFFITPTEGFSGSEAEINCTNNHQQAAISNNIVTVYSVSADTTCTVTLKAEPSDQQNEPR